MKFRSLMIDLAGAVGGSGLGVPGRLYDGWGLGSALQDRASAVGAGFTSARIWIVTESGEVRTWDVPGKQLGPIEAAGLPF